MSSAANLPIASVLNGSEQVICIQDGVFKRASSALLKGPRGPGIPNGGIQNQILGKQSDNDFDTVWIDAPTGGGSGSSTIIDITGSSETQYSTVGSIYTLDVQDVGFSLPICPGGMDVPYFEYEISFMSSVQRFNDTICKFYPFRYYSSLYTNTIVTSMTSLTTTPSRVQNTGIAICKGAIHKGKINVIMAQNYMHVKSNIESFVDSTGEYLITDCYSEKYNMSRNNLGDFTLDNFTGRVIIKHIA